MSLKNDFLDIFNKMKGDSPEYDENDMADKIGAKIKAYVSSCTLTVSPTQLTGADTSPAGTFTGSASVSWSTQGTPIASKIKAVYAGMKDGSKKDVDLAQAIADGLDTDAPTWSVSLSGQTVTTTTPPQTVPSGDSGVITSTFDSASVKSTLVSCFNAMKSMTSASDNPDDKFATELASAVETYYTSSANNGKGASHLAAVTFTVTVS